MTLIVILFLLYLIPSAHADELDRQQKALTIISDFAEKICSDVSLKGSSGSAELSGKVKAQLKGVVNKVADLGFESAAKYQKSNYEGLLQSDLVTALKDNKSCKLQIWNDLKDKLLSKTSAPASTGYDAAAKMEVLSWSDLVAGAKGVDGFADSAWFCQAQTFTGKTECHFGTKPPKPGCYVLLNRDRTAWIAVETAAKQLHVDYHAPDDGKNVNRSSGYGCGVPSSKDWWLLVNIN